MVLAPAHRQLTRMHQTPGIKIHERTVSCNTFPMKCKCDSRCEEFHSSAVVGNCLSSPFDLARNVHVRISPRVLLPARTLAIPNFPFYAVHVFSRETFTQCFSRTLRAKCSWTCPVTEFECCSPLILNQGFGNPL